MDIQKIESHLKQSKDHYISIDYNGLKLKKDSRTNKFLFSLDDVLAIAPNVQEFLTQLPSKGFFNGTELRIRKKHGTTFKEIGTVKLTFKNGEPPINSNNNTMQSENKVVESQNQQHQVPNSLGRPQTQQQTPPIALGYAQVPQHNLVDLMVKEGRYMDLVDKIAKLDQELTNTKTTASQELAAAKLDAKQEASSLKNEIEMLKLKNSTLELQVMTFEKMKELNKKEWHESEAVKEGIAALGAVLPHLLNKGQSSPALAAPATNSAIKNEFISALSSEQITETHTAYLKLVLKGMATIKDFTPALEQLLTQAGLTNE